MKLTHTQVPVFTFKLSIPLRMKHPQSSNKGMEVFLQTFNSFEDETCWLVSLFCCPVIWLSIPLRMKHIPIISVTQVLNVCILNFQFLWGWNEEVGKTRVEGEEINFQFLWGWNINWIFNNPLLSRVWLSIPLRMKLGMRWLILTAEKTFNSFEDETKWA